MIILKKRLNKKNIISISVIILIILVLCFILFKSEDGFDVNTILLKSVTKQGEGVSNNLKITNTKNVEQSFQISIKNLEGLVFLSENSFKLAPGDVKDLKIVFRDETLVYSPGVYVGAFVIKTDSGEKEIPIILEIQSKEVLFATNLDVSPEYKEIKPGGKTSVGVKAFNLRDTKMHTIEMTYMIKNFDGETIVSESESLVVGTEVLVTKTITLPKDIALGNYAFAVIAKYGDSVSTSSYLFSVVKKKILPSFGVNFFAIVIFIFLFGIIGLVYYMIHDRNKLFLDLRKQQLSELRFQIDKIKEQRKLSLAKAKTVPEKKRVVKKFKSVKKKVVKKIKRKHKKQKIEFKRLRKQKRKDKMKQKLNHWKREGFNVDELLVKIAKPTKKQMKKQIQKWKKGGFDTSVLKK